MKPIFTNTFNVTHNKNKSEVTVTFSHVYTEHNFTTKSGALTDVSAQIVDEVSSVIMSREGAIALARLLNEMVTGWGIDLQNK